MLVLLLHPLIFLVLLEVRDPISLSLHVLSIFEVLLVSLLEISLGTLRVVLVYHLLTLLILITLDVTIVVHLSIFNLGALCTNGTMLKG